jgi:hypothetical protein
MQVQINDEVVSYDTFDRKLIGHDLKICEIVNLEEESVISAGMIEIFDNQSVERFCNDAYDFAVIRVFDNRNVLTYEGKIMVVEMDGKKLTLTCRRKIDMAMDGFLTYTATNKNPVTAVKAILELLDANIHTASYTAVSALFETSGLVGEVRANFSYIHQNGTEVIDTKTYHDAINEICKLFHFYVYYSEGLWFFFVPEIYSQIVEISADDITSPQFESVAPEFNRLLVEWEGGESLAEFAGDTVRYDEVEQTLDISRAQNIMMNNELYVERTFNRTIAYYGYCQKYLSFTATQNYDIQNRYTYEKNGFMFSFRIISKIMKQNNVYEYRGVVL